MNKENKLAVLSVPKIPKKLQDRLMEKIMDKNEDKIIEKMQLRNNHVEAVKMLDKEIAELCNLTGIE